MPISRRDLLKKTFGFVTITAAAPRFRLASERLGRELLDAGASGRTLVVIELSGGNDGLNTVVPYADPLYPQMRARIGVDTSRSSTSTTVSDSIPS